MEITQSLKQRGQELVAELIRRKGNDSPPFPATSYAELLGNIEVKKADLGNRDAILLTLGNRHLVKLNQNKSSERQNFSLAHELAHIMLNQSRLTLALWMDFRGGGQHLKERLCNIVAAELLMPEGIFKRYVASYGLSINSIELLATKFLTSKEAAARRMAEVSEEPCVAICWKQIPGQGKREAKLYPSWSSGEHEILRDTGDTKVGSKSAIFSALTGDTATQAFELLPSAILPLGKRRRRIYVESKGFGQGPNKFVISLAFPQRLAKEDRIGNKA